jgi:CIC family chloride channel protein
VIFTRPLDWAKLPFGLFRDPQVGRRGRWILYSALIGTVAGIGAILFDLVFHAAQFLLLGKLGRFRPAGTGLEGGEGFGPENIWLLPVSLIVGGLISGALVHGLAPEAEGHGTDAVIRSFHHLRGKIRKRVPVIKAISSAITIGSGGSAGREGPIAQIGAGVGSYLGTLLKLTYHDRRILMMAGMAGGIGSIFRAPLGAAFFSAEVLYRKPEFEYEVLLPGLISAITGYSIYSTYAGWGFLFDVPDLDFHEPRHLLLYVALGVACAATGWLWPKVFYGVRDRVFKPMPVPAWSKPAIGAAMLGGIALLFPEALGMGYGTIQQAIEGSRTVQFLLIFAAVKVLATSLTISSGGSGGVFGPSLVIGGALGAAFGELANAYVPGLAPPTAACIMVGMGGFFAGVAKTPFAAVIMVMEMTGSYGLLVPSLLVAAIAYLCLPLAVSLYENQVGSRVDSPAHLGSFAVDVLKLVRVGDAFGTRPTESLNERTTLDEMVERAAGSRQFVYPVVDDAGRLTGEVSLDEIRRALLTEAPGNLVIVRDLMRTDIEPLCPHDDLATAAARLTDNEHDAISVVESLDSRRVLGTLSRRELILTYGRQMERLRPTDRHDGPV